MNGWKIKYYKGLGTSTAREFKEYFANKKEVIFTSDLMIRKQMFWIWSLIRREVMIEKNGYLQYNRNSYLDTNKTSVSYKDFIDKELIHFSKYDCDRSIPNLMDGLKISLRKILFAAFKKNLKNEIKGSTI